MSADGLLLLNLGSPAAPTRAAVSRYLRTFLSDPFVLDVSPWFRAALVHGWIAPTRAGKSARAYRKIWQPAGSPAVAASGGEFAAQKAATAGSPLIAFSRAFAEGMAQAAGRRWSVRLAMRYGEPDLMTALRDWGVGKIFVVPLYPQYAESSTRSALEACRVALRTATDSREAWALTDFFDQPEFIAAQARQIERAAAAFQPDHLLLSFHGLPEHHLTKLYGEHCLKSSTCCDAVGGFNRRCYRAQATATARAVTERLGFPAARVRIGFQSRLGRRPWIQPFTDVVISELAASGARRVLVSCPSFVADCLETLEEVQIRLREQFLAAGGQELRLAPALNAEPHWIEAFSRMVERPDLNWERLKF